MSDTAPAPTKMVLLRNKFYYIPWKQRIIIESLLRFMDDKRMRSITKQRNYEKNRKNLFLICISIPLISENIFSYLSISDLFKVRLLSEDSYIFISNYFSYFMKIIPREISSFDSDKYYFRFDELKRLLTKYEEKPNFKELIKENREDFFYFQYELITKINGKKKENVMIYLDSLEKKDEFTYHGMTFKVFELGLLQNDHKIFYDIYLSYLLFVLSKNGQITHIFFAEI